MALDDEQSLSNVLEKKRSDGQDGSSHGQIKLLASSDAVIKVDKTDSIMIADHTYVHGSLQPGENVKEKNGRRADLRIYRCGECDAFFVNVSNLFAHLELHIMSSESGKEPAEVFYIKPEDCGSLSDVKPALTSMEDKQIETQNVEVIRLPSLHEISDKNLIAATESTISSLPQIRQVTRKVKSATVESILLSEALCLGTKAVDITSDYESFVSNEAGPPYACDICGKRLSSVRSRDRHIGLHSGEKPHSCNTCCKKFANPYDLKKHCRTHTGEKPYQCDICKRCFAQSSTMTMHRRTHDRRTPSLCSICGNQFSSVKSLRLHVKLHSEETSFECMYCQKRFGQIGRLKRHMRNHTGERPYVCETCGKSFLTPRAYRAHNSTHSGERPYPCPFCPKKFADVGILRRHKRIHTGERPYKCDVCSRDFVQAESLRVHRRTHTGERPYKCTDCDKCFQSLSNLRTHARTHTKEKPFSCMQCGVTYSTNGQLVKHTVKVHQLASDAVSHVQAIFSASLIEDNKLDDWP